MACAKSLEDVLKIDYESDTTVLHERLNGKRLWSAVESNPARGANAELLQQFFSKVLGRLNSGKGRKSEKKLDAIGHWRPLSEKLQRHEECARGLLDLLEAQSLHANQRSQENPSSQAAQTPSRRRLTRKMSSLEATEESFANQNRSSGSGAPDANPFEGGDQDGFVSLPVAYRYKLDGVRTRRYADGHSVQNLGTAWQAVALADTIDLDIENCCFTLLLQVLEKVEPQHESWPSVKETLRLCATQRKHVIENKLKLTLPEGKFERRFASRHTREQCLHTGAAASISFLSLGGCDIVERYGLAFFGATEGEAGCVSLDILLEHRRGSSGGILDPAAHAFRKPTHAIAFRWHQSGP